MASASFKTKWGSAFPALAVNISLYAWIAVLVIGPNLFLVLISFFSARGGVIDAQLTLANFARLFERPTYPFLLAKTIAMAGSAATIASLVAIPLAYYTSRRIRSKSAVVLLFVVPLWISLLMRVFAWKIVLGEAGILNTLLLSYGLIGEPISSLIYNPYIAVFVMTNVVLPYVFLSTFVAVDRIPDIFLRASEDAGANTWTTFRLVIWPLAKPGIYVGFALAFLIAVGDYVTPAMVGGLDGTTIGMLIASQFGFASNWPFGAAIAILLVVTVAALLGIGFIVAQTPGTFEPQLERSQIAERKSGPVSVAVMIAGRAAFAIPLVLLYLPLFVMAAFSFNANAAQSFPFSGFTLDWYRKLGDNAGLVTALWRSLTIGSLAVVFGTILGTGFAIAFSRRKVLAPKLAQSIFVFPVALPGIILGISLALTFRFIDIGSSTVKVVIGHLVFVAPVIFLMVQNRLNSMDRNLEYAAADLGSSEFQAMIFVILPLLRSAIIGGAILGFTLSLDEVLVTLFLSPTEPTLPVFIWNQLRFGFTPEINAAFTLIALLSIAGVIGSALWLQVGPAGTYTTKEVKG